MTIDYMLTLTDKNLQTIAKNLLEYKGIGADDLRRIKTTKTKATEVIMSDPQFKKHLLKALKTYLSFDNIYDCFPFEEEMNDIVIVNDILREKNLFEEELNVKNREAVKKNDIDYARNLLIMYGYKVS